MKIILLSISSTLSLLFTQLKHPLSLGLILLLQTVLISMISGMIGETFWFSYILFLIFLGGMLILFIYVTSLASNEIISLSTKIILFFVIMLPIMAFFFKEIMNPQNQESNHFMINNNMMNSLLKLYNKPTKLITILLACYLFLTLIAVVKITNIFKGPLRHMN